MTSLTGTALFILFPLLDAVKRSFFTAMGGRFTGLRAYAEVFANKAFQLAAANTARFTLVCIPLLFVVSLGLALAVFAAADKAEIVKTGLLIPMAIPAASMIAVWRLLFADSGIINGITGAATDWFAAPYAFPVLVGTYLWKNLGYNLLLWLAGLYGIPAARFEAAMIDGANGFQRLLFITLPSLRPQIFTIAALSLVNSFKVFREAYLLGGNYPDDNIYLLQHLWSHWFASLDIDLLCAAAAVLAIALFAAIGVLRVTLREAT
ncbi:MAG: sugar ABC transporter permease [Oscillospiraceae bacterium]|jgi:multiple sugar transport system permease protein|nr:sugar ABC transporter permease [Oscillospiraceae bacterium]